MPTKKKIHLVAAARPNFMKIAPLYHELARRRWAAPEIVHTGQHSDPEMSGVFFQALRLPSPHHHLEISKGASTGVIGHGEQTARVMSSYEPLCREEQPDLVVVVGDVNSSLAATLVATKLGIPVAHVEAGLRSGDRSMPEELNRRVIDSISDLLLTPSEDADENLLREGIAPEQIRFVGNVMIDSFEMLREEIESAAQSIEQGGYGIVTLHRPANVDDRERLQECVSALLSLTKLVPFVFPLHPRTERNLKNFKLLHQLESAHNLTLLPPLSYTEFLARVLRATVVVTDSGGIQEETSYLGVPCLTLRENTERPVTLSLGTNRLTTIEQVENDLKKVLSCETPYRPIIPLWDGHAAKRISDEFERFLRVA